MRGAEEAGSIEVVAAASEAAAIQSFANVLGCNKVLAPALIFHRSPIDFFRFQAATFQ
jgi:hypothetical protein